MGAVTKKKARENASILSIFYSFLLILFVFSNFTSAQTVSHNASKIKSGQFGSDFGGGNYSFPDSLAVGKTGPNAGLDVSGNLLVTSASESEFLSDAGADTYLYIIADGLNNAVKIGGYGGGGTVDRPLILQYSGGNVGVGTFTSPNAKLEINGGASNGLSLSASNDLFVNDSSGNVGIGTANPGAKLEVGGETRVGYLNLTATGVEGNIRNANMLIGYNDLFLRGSSGGADVYINDNGGNVGVGMSSPSAKLEIQGSGTGGLSLNASNDLFVNDSSGNVGIGIANPTQKLEITGNLTIGSGSTTDDDYIFFDDGTVYLSWDQNDYALEVNEDFQLKEYTPVIEFEDTTVNQDDFNLQLDANKFQVIHEDSDIALLTFTNTGNVGVWSSNPQARLEINGSASNGLSLNVSNDLFVNDSSGNVGIGTANLDAKLDLTASSTDQTTQYHGVEFSTTKTPAATDATPNNAGIYNILHLSGSSNMTGSARGIANAAYNDGSGTINILSGIASWVGASSTGNITTANSIYLGTYGSGTGIISTYNAIDIGDIGGANTPTTMTGINIAASTGSVGTSKYGLYINNIAGASTNNYAIVTNAGNIVFNEGGDASTDFRVEGYTDANLLFVDASTNSVGIGTASPQSALHVQDGYYAQFENFNAGAPPAGDCDADTERGRLAIDTTSNRLFVCMGATRGWDYVWLND
ncbi:MAG: hypothetical protein AB1567_11825 [bacterium]